MKIGRNDPCYCGSGKKFKKCCLKQQDAARELANIEWEEWFAKDRAIGEANVAEADAKLAAREKEYAETGK